MRGRIEGFTLIEILIVVALIGVLAGIAAPTVAAGIEQFNIISAGQQVASTLRAARFQAIARNRNVRVLFNSPAAGQYETEVWNTATSVWDSLTTSQSLPNDVSFGDGVVNITIDTQGRITPATAITVTNGNVEHDRTITVSTSGRIALQ